MILPILTIAPSDQRGRGVFATESIEVGTTIEISPVLVVNPTERAELEKTILYDYIFEWGLDEKQAAVALGYASMYNHSVDANCKYDMDFDHKTIQIQTKRDIAVDEELCINYNGDGITDKSVWFDLK